MALHLSNPATSLPPGTTVRVLYTEHFLAVRPGRYCLPKKHRVERKLSQWELFSEDPTIDAIDAETIRKFRENGKAAGFSPSGLDGTIRIVMALLRFAHDRGLIAWMPKKPRRRTKLRQVKLRTGPKAERRTLTPLSVENLNQVLGAARTLPDVIEGIPKRYWWPALILLVVDTGEYAADLLKLKLDAYDRATGTLTIKGKKLTLHAHTANALEVLRSFERTHLFPWPNTDLSQPLDGLYREYRKILHRAGLPPTERKALIRLRNIALSAPDTLDRINPYLRIQPVLGTPRRPAPPKRPPVPNGPDGPDDSQTQETLREFFEFVYCPVQLLGRSPRTVEKYRSVLNRLAAFLGREPEFEDLNDESLNDFKIWCAAKNSAVTANTNLRHLFALWRHAWRKRRVTEQPRDVDFLPEMKRNPEAWSTEEMGRLLKAAGETEGDVRGIPARDFWPALIGFLYDTGLRLGAALHIRSQDFDLETGTVHVRPEHQKQKAAQVFRVHPDTLNAIRKIHPADRELLFDYPYSGKWIRKIFKLLGEVLERAELPTGKKNKFHKIRRTTATAICDALDEEAARRHLGQSHISVTRRYLDQTKITPRVNVSDSIPRPKWEGGRS